MITSTPSGGAFKGPSTKQNFNHNHASAMAHSAHQRLAVAKALTAPKAPQVPGAVPVPGAPMVAPPPPGGSFKAHVAHAVAKRGVHVTVQHVHGAIDSLTQKGQLTPFQGNSLKQHNGPLVGQAGQNTMGAIANELVAPKVPK